MTHNADEQRGLYICPLTERSIFKITGEDSEKFLQGQLSCDMREVNANHSLLATHCNPKGGILSVLRVHCVADDYFLSVNNENLDDSIANLNKYIMFSKADIENLNNQWTGFGVFGEQAFDFINSQFQNVPEEVNQLIIDDDKFVVKVPGNRYEIWLKSPVSSVFSQQTLVSNNLYGYLHWKKQEILNAIADITPQTSASYIPQMCNLQNFSAISFKKGCYTGQEVITRLHFRGKLNKILITAKLSSNCVDNTFAVGSDINCATREKIGKVLQQVTIDHDTYLQIIVSYKYAKDNLILCDGSILETLPLPYVLDPELFIRKD